MFDRSVQFPQRYQLQKVAGTDDIYDIIPAPGEIQNEGTLINKSTLLTDAVASMFGFGASAVPNDMFNVLTHAGDLHVWKRTVLYQEGQSAGYNLGTAQGVQFVEGDGLIYVADTLSVSESGVLSASGTQYIWEDIAGNNSLAQGKFLFARSSGPFYYVSENATLTFETSPYFYLYCSSAQLATGYPAIPPGESVIDYPVSPNSDAYQEGTVGDTTIEYMGQVGNKVQIETGSYVGTGTYGKNNPNTLMFGFKPKIIIVQAVGKDSPYNDNNDDPHGWGLMLTNRLTSTFQEYLGMGYRGSLTGGNMNRQYGKIDGSTVSWYSDSSGDQALTQLNSTNVTYQYIAIA